MKFVVRTRSIEATMKKRLLRRLALSICLLTATCATYAPDGEKYEVLRNAPRVELPYLDTDTFAEYLAVDYRGRVYPREEGRITLTGRGGERPL